MDDVRETDQADRRDDFGLSKNARLEARRAADVADANHKPLDPPFPFRMIEFHLDVVSRNKM